MTMRLFLLLMCGVMLAGCGGAPDADLNRPGAIRPVRDAGFADIAAVYHDVLPDVYFVSNMNGGPLDEDGNGFISVVSGDGEVLALKWVDAAADGIPLHAPKGMTVVDTVLYVADLRTLWLFNRDSGELLDTIPIPGATYLNALVAHISEAVYFTDTGLHQGADGLEPSGTDAVYRLWPNGRLDTLAMGPELGRPTGIALRGDSIWVVGSAIGELYRIEDGRKVDIRRLADGLDGLTVIPTGMFVTDPAAGTVLRGDPTGEFQVVVEGLREPAAIGFDRFRFRLLVVTGGGAEFQVIPLVF